MGFITKIAVKTTEDGKGALLDILRPEWAATSIPVDGSIHHARITRGNLLLAESDNTMDEALRAAMRMLPLCGTECLLESELFDIKRVYRVASIKVDQAPYHEFLLKSDHTRRNANGQMLRLESLFRILGWQNWDEIDLYQFGKYLRNTKSEFRLFRFGSSRQATIDLLRELEDFLGWLMDFRIPKAMRVRIDGFYGMAKIYRENLQEVEALNRRNTA